MMNPFKEPVLPCFRCLRAIASDQFKAHAENAVLIIVADDFERTDLGSIGYMSTDTEAVVVVSNGNDAYGVGSTFWQAFQVELSCSFLLGDEFHRHIQVTCDDFIDFDFSSSVGACGKAKSSLLFFRSMCAETARPQPKRLTIVRLTMCSQVCIGGYSCLLCSLSWGCCSIFYK